MGVVYRARHAGRHRIVALKMLREGRLAGADAVRRFLLEAEAAGRLDHPHIVPVHEVGEINGRHFFTMRLVEGGSLADWTLDTETWTLRIRPRDGLASVEPPRYSVSLMAQLVVKIARAVHYAHERGILHRDLKPANILLDVRGEPLVSDFGLAKLTETDSSSGLTLSGTVLELPPTWRPSKPPEPPLNTPRRRTSTASARFSINSWSVSRRCKGRRRSIPCAGWWRKNPRRRAPTIRTSIAISTPSA